MIRFIHLADVHLGAVPDRGCPWSHEAGRRDLETFRPGRSRLYAEIRWICYL